MPAEGGPLLSPETQMSIDNVFESQCSGAQVEQQWPEAPRSLPGTPVITHEQLEAGMSALLARRKSWEEAGNHWLLH